eukprot:gene6653-8232_t
MQQSTSNSNNLSTLGNNQQPEKTKEKEKAKKKLAIFLDLSLDSFKRFKGLSSFITNSDESEIDKVFKENSYQVYQTLLSTFSAYEVGAYKGKQHYAEKEVLKLMQLLKRILIHLEGFVKKGWQVKSIINILEKMLGIENIQSLRMSGFEVLLVFLEVMEKPDRYKLDLFASSIDFTPFTADYTSKITFSRKVFSAAGELKRFIVMQSQDQPTKDDACKLFELIFKHTETRLSNFQFWFDLLKSHYLTVLYPTICKQNGLLSPSDITGFVSHCPHELQVIVINYLCNWITSNQQIREFFLYNINPLQLPSQQQSEPLSSSPSSASSSLSLSSSTSTPTPTTSTTPGTGNISILLEIFKQSCRLPLKYHEVIKKSISTFQSLFLENSNDLDLGEELYTYQTFIFNEMLHVFETESNSFEKERELIGSFIIGVYKRMIEIYHTLKPQVKEIVLHAMLQGTLTLLRKSNPNKSVTISLEQNIVSTTLYGWIRSKETSSKMWDVFHSQFEELFYRPEVIKQIRSKLLQVTLVLKDFIYPLSQRRIQKKQKDIRNTSKGGEPKSLDYQEAPPEIPSDPAIATHISWDVESCQWIWHCLLDLFKNLQRIKEPQIHELATQILVDIVDLFIRTEQEVEFADYLDKNKPPHISLFNIFGPRLFDICLMDSKYTKSKVLSLGCLCRLVCRHHPQYPVSILSHFYGVINNALISPMVGGIDLSWSIILNSSNIFNLSIPGANILIPTYLYKIKCILTLKNGETTPPLEVRKKCIVIICSLIFYPNQFPNLEIYNQREIKGKLVGNNLTMSDMKKDIVEVLHITLKTEKSVDNKMICIWGLSVFLMEEFNCNYNQEIVNEIVDALTGHTLNIDQFVARAALDALASIGLIFSKLNKQTINRILLALCNNILKALPEIESGNTSISESTISNHYHCLLDWVCVDNSIFEDPIYFEFRALLFRCIEEGLGQKGEFWGVAASSAGKQQEILSLEFAKDPKAGSKNLTSKRLVSKIGTFKSLGGSPVSQQMAAEEEDTSTHKSTVIRDSCDMLLGHVLNFVHNFPSKEGAEIFTSMIDEDDDLDNDNNRHTNIVDEANGPISNSSSSSNPSSTMPLFCVLNENALISVVEVPKPSGNGTYARLFIRDSTGKYVWNFDLDYNENRVPPPPAAEILQMYAKEQTLTIIDQNQNVFVLENRHSKNPVIKPVEKDERLNNLLLSLSTNHPECLPVSGIYLNQPLIHLKPSLVAEFTKNQVELESFIEKEKNQNLDRYSLPPVGPAWALVPPETPHPVISQSSRLLLSYLGFLDFNTVNNNIRQLESNHKLGRALAQLDITPGREILKIGVIYTAEGQDDQKEILHNCTSTPMYREFVDGLGWPIDVATHAGYLGGLDKKKTTGTTAPYYASPTLEVVFHDISRMPTNITDPQQIHKKRHVGNDIVNIIWSEHIRDYSPTTITSQFNDAHIIIYPLPNGLFRVQIYRKESKVPMFGPLIHGMAVNKQLISTLVRQTAINAYRYVRYSTPSYSKPYVLRKLRIKEIVDRYSSDRNYVDYVHSIASGSNSFVQQQPPQSQQQATSPVLNGSDSIPVSADNK